MKINNRFSLTFDIFRIFYGNHRSKTQKIAVLLTLLAYGFYALAKSVGSTFILALVNYPICWSLTMINVYELVLNMTLGIFSIIIYHVLAYLTKNSDILICSISHIFFFTSAIWTAFARNNWQIFSNSILFVLANYQKPLTMSILSKSLRPREVNIAFIFIAAANQLITSFGDSLFKKIYINAPIHHRNIILFITGGIIIIPFVLNM